jgi:hypothetical protein
MSNFPEPSHPRRLSEDEAHQVLARAAELDARRPATLSVEQLWASAAEAGISREAFTQATAELEAGKLGPKTIRVALASGLADLGRVALASVVVYLAIVDPNRPIAQLIGLACAVFGAYVGVGSIARWIGRQRHRLASTQASQAGETDSVEDNSHNSMAVRVLARQSPAGSAA